MKSKKVALSLSGGGSSGGYAIGVIDYLHSVLNIDYFPVIYGTSTGSLIATKLALSVIQNDWRHWTQLKDIYSTINTADILKPNKFFGFNVQKSMATSILSGNNYIFDTSPLSDLIKKYVTDKDLHDLVGAANRAENPVEVGFCAVCLETGTSKIFSSSTCTDINILRKAILASASQPVFMQPVQIEGQTYVDGGVLNYTPAEQIIRSQHFKLADVLLAISLDMWQVPESEDQWSLMNILKRTIQLLTHNVYKDDIVIASVISAINRIKTEAPQLWESIRQNIPSEVDQYIQHVTVSKPVIHVKPSHKLSYQSLEFKQPQMKKLIRLGFKDAQKQLGDL